MVGLFFSLELIESQSETSIAASFYFFVIFAFDFEGDFFCAGEDFFVDGFFGDFLVNSFFLVCLVLGVDFGFFVELLVDVFLFFVSLGFSGSGWKMMVFPTF